jgi:DNA polymerase III sliding clamp (beta) subunit (PCNA family)
VKFAKKLKPEMFRSTHEFRAHLRELHLDVEGKNLVATDGHRIIVIPVDVERGDKSGPITEDAMRAARGHEDKGTDLARIEAKRELRTGINGKGPKFLRPKSDVSFPVYKNVIKQPKGQTVTFGVNPQYLLDCAKAMGVENVRVTVVLEAKHEHSLNPLFVRSLDANKSDGLCVVMPVLTPERSPRR